MVFINIAFIFIFFNIIQAIIVRFEKKDILTESWVPLAAQRNIRSVRTFNKNIILPNLILLS